MAAGDWTPRRPSIWETRPWSPFPELPQFPPGTYGLEFDTYAPTPRPGDFYFKR